jgi:hypothetical protein
MPFGIIQTINNIDNSITINQELLNIIYQTNENQLELLNPINNFIIRYKIRTKLRALLLLNYS